MRWIFPETPLILIALGCGQCRESSYSIMTISVGEKNDLQLLTRLSLYCASLSARGWNFVVVVNKYWNILDSRINWFYPNGEF